jgi:hypothetical protein
MNLFNDELILTDRVQVFKPGEKEKQRTSLEVRKDEDGASGLSKINALLTSTTIYFTSGLRRVR